MENFNFSEQFKHFFKSFSVEINFECTHYDQIVFIGNFLLTPLYFLIKAISPFELGISYFQFVFSKHHDPWLKEYWSPSPKIEGTSELLLRIGLPDERERSFRVVLIHFYRFLRESKVRNFQISIVLRKIL